MVGESVLWGWRACFEVGKHAVRAMYEIDGAFFGEKFGPG